MAGDPKVDLVNSILHQKGMQQRILNNATHAGFTQGARAQERRKKGDPEQAPLFSPDAFVPHDEGDEPPLLYDAKGDPLVFHHPKPPPPKEEKPQVQFQKGPDGSSTYSLPGNVILQKTADGKVRAFDFQNGKPYPVETMNIRGTRDAKDPITVYKFTDRKGAEHYLNPDPTNLDYRVTPPSREPPREAAPPRRETAGPKAAKPRPSPEPTAYERVDRAGKILKNAQASAKERLGSVKETLRDAISESTNEMLHGARSHLKGAIENSTPEVKARIRGLAEEARSLAQEHRDLKGTDHLLFPALILRDARRGLINDPKVAESAQGLLTGYKADSLGKIHVAWDKMTEQMNRLPPDQQEHAKRMWGAVEGMGQQYGVDVHEEFTKGVLEEANKRGFGSSSLGRAAADYLDASRKYKMADFHLYQPNLPETQPTKGWWQNLSDQVTGKAYAQPQPNNQLPPGMTPEMAAALGYQVPGQSWNNIPWSPQQPQQWGPQGPFQYGPQMPTANNMTMPQQDKWYKNPLVWMMALPMLGSLAMPLMMMLGGGFGGGFGGGLMNPMMSMMMPMMMGGGGTMATYMGLGMLGNVGAMPGMFDMMRFGNFGF